ncbi:hypothetical protein quinque_008761 [Culex quinquefasciatus]
MDKPKTRHVLLGGDHNCILEADDWILKQTAGFREALVELKQRRKYTNSFSEWWSYDFKNKVKQFYKGKAIQFNQTNSVRKARFHKRLEELTEKQAEGENVQDEIEVAKTKLLPAGYPAEFLVGFDNKGSDDFIVETIQASFRYRMDFDYFFQNISAIGHPFGMNIAPIYRDASSNQFSEAVFKKIFSIIEVD